MMDMAADIRRRLDRLTADPASIEGSHHPEIDALREGPEPLAISILRTALITAIALGPIAITTMARHA